ncbi:hypothetical protein DFJ63DRAFT_311648 [Scheffersomyces coipomensis]|uniref:uncharacterized protein n=1 Tax=Scheffersomyces coipomensis TaxID=1788519 RepID=UPI00315DA522
MLTLTLILCIKSCCAFHIEFNSDSTTAILNVSQVNPYGACLEAILPKGWSYHISSNIIAQDDVICLSAYLSGRSLSENQVGYILAASSHIGLHDTTLMMRNDTLIDYMAKDYIDEVFDELSDEQK